MLKETAQARMFEAMKNKDKKLKDAYSMLLSQLKNKEISVRRDLTAEEEQEVVSKMVKQAKEAIDCIPSGTNTDFVQDREFEIEVYSQFLPKQLTAGEIKQIICQTLSELGLENVTNQTRGMVMKNIIGKTKGIADGKLVAELVAEFMA